MAKKYNYHADNSGLQYDVIFIESQEEKTLKSIEFMKLKYKSRLLATCKHLLEFKSSARASQQYGLCAGVIEYILSKNMASQLINELS